MKPGIGAVLFDAQRWCSCFDGNFVLSTPVTEAGSTSGPTLLATIASKSGYFNTSTRSTSALIRTRTRCTPVPRAITFAPSTLMQRAARSIVKLFLHGEAALTTNHVSSFRHAFNPSSTIPSQPAPCAWPRPSTNKIRCILADDG
jgi:hypothetical protein